MESEIKHNWKYGAVYTKSSLKWKKLFVLQVDTLQVVLTTDGEKSFVFFIYTDIQWGEAGIGFNAGDGVRSYTLPGSRSPAAKEIEDGSNVGVEGVYAYRVDLPEIASPEVDQYKGET